MQDYLSAYIKGQQDALAKIPLESVEAIIKRFHESWEQDRQLFVIGNGGSAANASHFVTDLGKSASDAMGKPFRCMSLNDNVSWLTAIGNDYAYHEVFSRQLLNFARPGDTLFVLSVSGSSPNVVTAVEWAKNNGIYVIALTGGKRGKVAELADFTIAIDSFHYGRVEDAQMGICHMICYSFIEGIVK
jgi:D-sedoheptulose 7-phosphate isomerase